MTTLLSANAAPFHPFYEPVNLAIYNDGVPCMTLVSEEEVCEILHGIQDDALDERFPPSAADAAELDAVADFVEFMAMLAYMEEREERARLTFCHIKKRWEARRSAGLIGRPRPAKHSVEEVKHYLPKAVQSTGLVHNSHRHIEVKFRHQEFAVRQKAPHYSKHIAGARKTMPLQQPRKN
jgi:hypothetical protein